MPAPTTIDLDTELSAVNSILGSIGQSPVTTLGANLEIQAETEFNVVAQTATGDGETEAFTLYDGYHSTDVLTVTVAGSANTAYSISGTTLTFDTAPGDGEAISISFTKTTFAIGFSYDSPSQISVTVNGVLATDYVVSSGNIVFGTAPASNAKVLFTKKVETYNTLANPEVAFILQLLKETNIEVQSEGWVFNTESHVEFSPSGNKIPIPSNVLRLDVHDDFHVRTTNVVKRGGYLYDKIKHSDQFTDKVSCDVVYLWPFEDLPQPFKRYIVQKASVRAATQLVSNPTLVQLLQQQEAYTRAICMEYECNQGDHNYMGLGDDTSYQTYLPYLGLRR